MSGRFMFNPFGNQKPLQHFGQLQNTMTGLQYEGLPYIGPVLDFKDDDPEEFLPQLRNNGCVAVFDLSKTGDMDQYRALIQKVCDKRAVLSVEERAYDEATKNWRVLVRWFEPYYQAPDAALMARKEAAKVPVTVARETEIRSPKDAAFANIDKSELLSFLEDAAEEAIAEEKSIAAEELDKALV